METQPLDTLSGISSAACQEKCYELLDGCCPEVLFQPSFIGTDFQSNCDAVAFPGHSQTMTDSNSTRPSSRTSLYLETGALHLQEHCHALTILALLSIAMVVSLVMARIACVAVVTMVSE